MVEDRRTSRGGILWLAIFLLALPATVSGDAEDASARKVTGAAVRTAVPHVRESFDDLRRLAPGRRVREGGPRIVPFRRTPRPVEGPAPGPISPVAVSADGAAVSTSRAWETGLLVPQPIRRASTVEIDFPGLQNFPLPGGRDVIPPDTMGAAGPNHRVSILNSEFGIFDKRGGMILDNVTLQEFWASLGTNPGEPADFPFDPKILFDQYTGRFVAVSLDCTVAPHSWVLVAVSGSSDPTGVWNKFAIDADLDNNALQSANSADYPGLGVDASNIYISANMFTASDVAQYSKVWVIPKAQDLSGANPITWFEFRNPEAGRFSVQPAHSFGAVAAEYLLFEGNGSALRLARIDNVTGTPVWHPSAAVPVAPYTADSSLAGAPQNGSSGLIDTADTRMLDAVYRNGSVWGTHHVPGAGGKTEVAWYRIDPSTDSAIAQGRIADPNRWYYYPSIAVNQDNVAALGFSGSSASEFAGAFYTLVWPSTPPQTDPVTLLKSGEAPYDKTLNGPSIRWGDFSATSVDPSDDNTFWTLQEYAAPQASTSHGLESMWGTWWGRIVPGQPPPPPSGSGGGGGGCTAAGGSSADAAFGSSMQWFLVLLLPAALYGYRRARRPRKDE